MVGKRGSVKMRGGCIFLFFTRNDYVCQNRMKRAKNRFSLLCYREVRCSFSAKTVIASDR